ncbi:MAG: ParB N-terminal domain-containing protein [Oscillospiraceae bacterium]|nr:ParB N-terminal domain-containing protein [Oscillospiraceae bacterium]
MFNEFEKDKEDLKPWESNEEYQEYFDHLFELVENEEAFVPSEEEAIQFEDLLSLSNINEFPYEDPNERVIFDAPSAKKIDQSFEPENFISDSRLKYADVISYIHITNLKDLDYSVNFFPLPDDEEFSNLVQSIRNFGVLSPLLVQKDKDSDKYIVINGRSRRGALFTLYNQTSYEAYLYAPCLILDETIDFSTIQGIIISANLVYRKIPKDVQIRAILMLDSLLSKSNSHKREINITDEIAYKAGISKSTANTIRGFKRLSPLALDLLFKEYISRGTARLLSMIKDHEKQDAIINELGNEINDLDRVRELIYGSKADKPKVDESKIELQKEDSKPSLPKVPKNTKIEIYVHQEEVEDVLNSLIKLKGKVILKHNVFKGGEIDKYFKVNLNYNHISQYIKNGFVTKDTVNLVRSVDPRELVKFA